MVEGYGLRLLLELVALPVTGQDPHKELPGHYRHGVFLGYRHFAVRPVTGNREYPRSAMRPSFRDRLPSRSVV